MFGNTREVVQCATHMRAIVFYMLTCYTSSSYDVETITLHAMSASGVTSRVRVRAVSRRVLLVSRDVAFFLGSSCRR